MARAPRLAGGSAPSLFLSGVYRQRTTCPVGARACGASRPAELWPHEKKEGSGWKASRKTGRRASMPECQDVRMSECQSVRMSECQSVRMLECQNVRVSECQDAGHDGSEERRGGTGFRMPPRRRARRGGERASQSFSRGRRPAFPQHSMPRRGARVKGGLGDDGKKVIFAMSS